MHNRIRFLETIDPSSPGFWDATITFAERGVFFDLTIDGEELTAADLADLPQQPEELEPLDRAARLAILEDARSGDEDAAAFLYVTHHQKVLSPDDFRRLFGTDRPIWATWSRCSLVCSSCGSGSIRRTRTSESCWTTRNRSRRHGLCPLCVFQLEETANRRGSRG